MVSSTWIAINSTVYNRSWGDVLVYERVIKIMFDSTWFIFVCRANIVSLITFKW